MGCTTAVSFYERETLGSGLIALSIAYALQVRNILKIVSRYIHSVTCKRIPFTSSQLTKGLSIFVFCANGISHIMLSVERIREYTDFPQEAPWTLPYENVPKRWPSDGEVVFKDFKLRYREDLPLTLKGVSFLIKSGEKVTQRVLLPSKIRNMILTSVLC